MSLATAAVRGFLVFIEIAIAIGIQIVPFAADEGFSLLEIPGDVTDRSDGGRRATVPQ